MPLRYDEIEEVKAIVKEEIQKAMATKAPAKKEKEVKKDEKV